MAFAWVLMPFVQKSTAFTVVVSKTVILAVAVQWASNKAWIILSLLSNVPVKHPVLKEKGGFWAATVAIFPSSLQKPSNTISENVCNENGCGDFPNSNDVIKEQVVDKVLSL